MSGAPIEKNLDGELFAAAFSADPDPVVLTDRLGAVVWVNPAVELVLGWTPDRFARCGLALVHPEDRTAHESRLQAASEQPGAHRIGMVRVMDDRADWQPFELVQTNLLADHGVVVTRMRTVVTASPVPANVLDEVTGLPGRAAIRQAIEERLHGPETSAAVLFLDLDGFKGVNDRLGHAAGDAVLIEVARRLRDRVRPSELLVRWGGDEFVVLVDVPGVMLATTVAARLQRAITAAPFVVDGERVELGVSIGVAFADHRAGIATLIRTADEAMYAAKRGGGGVVVAESAFAA